MWWTYRYHDREIRLCWYIEYAHENLSKWRSIIDYDDKLSILCITFAGRKKCQGVCETSEGIQK